MIFVDSEDEENLANQESYLNQTISSIRVYKFLVQTSLISTADEVYAIIQAHLKKIKTQLVCQKVLMIDYNPNKKQANKSLSEDAIKQIKLGIDPQYYSMKLIDERFPDMPPFNIFQENIANSKKDENIELDIEISKSEYSKFPFFQQSDQLIKSQKFIVEIQGEVNNFNKIQLKQIILQDLELTFSNQEEKANQGLVEIPYKDLSCIELGSFLSLSENQYEFESLYKLDSICSLLSVQQFNEYEDQRGDYEVYLTYKSIGQVKIILKQPKVIQTEDSKYLIATQTPEFYATTATYHMYSLLEQNEYQWHQIHNILLSISSISTYMKINSTQQFAIKLHQKQEKNLSVEKIIDICFSSRLLPISLNKLTFSTQYLFLVLLSNNKIRLQDINKIINLFEQNNLLDRLNDMTYLLQTIMKRTQDQKIDQFLTCEIKAFEERLLINRDNENKIDENYQEFYRVTVTPSRLIFHLPTYEYNCYLIGELEKDQDSNKLLKSIIKIDLDDEGISSFFIKNIYYREMLMQFVLLNQNFSFLGYHNNQAYLIQLDSNSNQIEVIQNRKQLKAQLNCQILTIVEQVGQYSSINNFYKQSEIINLALSKTRILSQNIKTDDIDKFDGVYYGIIQEQEFENLKAKLIKKCQSINPIKNIQCLLIQLNGYTSLFYPQSMVQIEQIQRNMRKKYLLPKRYYTHQNNSDNPNNIYLIDYNKYEPGWVDINIAKQISQQLIYQHQELLNDQQSIFKTLNQLFPFDDILAEQIQITFRRNYNILLKQKYNLSNEYFFKTLQNNLISQLNQQAETSTRIFPKNCSRLFSFIDQHNHLKENQIFVQIDDGSKLETITGPVILINQTDTSTLIKQVIAIQPNQFQEDFFKQFRNIVVVSNESRDLFNPISRVTIIQGDYLKVSKNIESFQLKENNQQTINVKKSVDIFLEKRLKTKSKVIQKMTQLSERDGYLLDNQLFLDFLKQKDFKILQDEGSYCEMIQEMFEEAIQTISKFSLLLNSFNKKYELISPLQIYSLLFENRNGLNKFMINEFEELLLQFVPQILGDIVNLKDYSKLQSFCFDLKREQISRFNSDLEQDSLLYFSKLSSSIHYLCLLILLNEKQVQSQLIQELFLLDIEQFKTQIINAKKEGINEGLLGFFWIVFTTLFIN